MKSNVQRFENAFNFVYRGVKSEPRPTYLFCHEELEIYCHYEGSAATLIEDAIYPLEDNSVVIIRPYVLHKTNIGAGAQELRTLLNVRRSLLDEYISNSRVSRVLDSFFAHNTAGGCIIRPSEPDLAAIERSFIAIHEATQRQCADKYLLVALNIMQILVVLSEYLDQKSSQKAAQPAYNRIILRIMEEVNANLFEPSITNIDPQLYEAATIRGPDVRPAQGHPQYRANRGALRPRPGLLPGGPGIVCAPD